jgi:hypothetical protein
MNSSFADFSKGYSQLTSKYKIAYVNILPDTEYAAKKSLNHNFVLIPEAQAVFGFNDVSITVGDIPRIIMDAVQQGLVSSFTQFMGSFLDKMIQKIEDNYKIANFLYYSDALVNGQYADDYLNKYVSEPLDRQIVKNFIPQFNCNTQNQNLKPIFQAKASQYLGFDPSSLDVNDPQYYQKLSQVGSFMASEQGQQLYYQDLASQTESAAQQAIQQELTSSGLKTPRDTLDNSISTSINTIVSGEKAGLEAVLQLGISNADSTISAMVSQLTETLFTKFVFPGATSSGPRSPSTIAVLKEQSTCLAAAQLAPIVPITGTEYQQPPAPPAAADLQAEALASQCIQNWSSLAVSDKNTCVSQFSHVLTVCAGARKGQSICQQVTNFMGSGAYQYFINPPAPAK